MAMSRRTFLKAAAAVASPPVLGVGYGLLEASRIRVTRTAVALPRLPAAFAGKTVALLTDLHLGPFNSLSFVRSAVEATNALKPDLIALPGDFVHRGADCIRPCLQALAELRAPLGVFAVPGNHDLTDGGRPLRRAFTEFAIRDVTNRGEWVEAGRDRLRVGGVDDLWWGRPDLDAALRGTPAEDVCLLLCHNPDFAETIADDRVGLVLSGHLHGGQIVLPGCTRRWVPSRYGLKYLCGLVRAPHTQVFVSRGLGCIGVPLRIGSPPEINLLTLGAVQAGNERRKTRPARSPGGDVPRRRPGPAVHCGGRSVIGRLQIGRHSSVRSF
jgi:predicted MPP superfamily phosphohydrolase